MRIFVPLTFYYRPTFEALEGWDHRQVPLRNDRQMPDYLDYFTDRWADGHGFVNCEHDVVPVAEQLWALHVCPEGWCSFNEYDGGPPTLSLARFRREFITANPTVWDDLRVWHSGPGGRQPLWTLLDSWLVSHADRACHVHERPHVRNDRPEGPLH